MTWFVNFLAVGIAVFVVYWFWWAKK